MNEFAPHLSFEEIADMVIDHAYNSTLVEHLRTCSRCSFEKDAVEQIVTTMRQDRTEDAPAYALASILRAFDERPVQAADPKPTLVEKISAALRFDSAKLGPAHGFRSGHASAGRQILLSAGDITFDLRLKRVSAGFDLHGQILGDVEHGNISLESSTDTRSASVGLDGEFKFDAVPEGVYRFIFHSESITAEFAELDIS